MCLLVATERMFVSFLLPVPPLCFSRTKMANQIPKGGLTVPDRKDLHPASFTHGETRSERASDLPRVTQPISSRAGHKLGGLTPALCWDAVHAFRPALVRHLPGSGSQTGPSLLTGPAPLSCSFCQITSAPRPRQPPALLAEVLGFSLLFISLLRLTVSTP